VQITPFGDVSEQLRGAAESEAHRLAQFLGWDDPDVCWGD